MITNYTKITNKTKNQTLISQRSSSIPYSSAIHITFSSSQSPKHNYMKFIQNVPPELQRTTKIQSFPWENTEQCNDLLSHFYTSLHQVTYCRANPWDYAVALFHSHRTAAPSVRFCSPIGAFLRRRRSHLRLDQQNRTLSQSSRNLWLLRTAILQTWSSSLFAVQDWWYLWGHWGTHLAEFWHKVVVQNEYREGAIVHNVFFEKRISSLGH